MSTSQAMLPLDTPTTWRKAPRLLELRRRAWRFAVSDVGREKLGTHAAVRVLAVVLLPALLHGTTLDAVLVALSLVLEGRVGGCSFRGAMGAATPPRVCVVGLPRDDCTTWRLSILTTLGAGELALGRAAEGAAGSSSPSGLEEPGTTMGRTAPCDDC